MTVLRMDHVSVVVDDLEAAIAFFSELGLDVEGRTPVEGPWVDGVNGMYGVRVEIAMMQTPDGHNKLELTKFFAPELTSPEPDNAPPNTLGLRSVMFAVDDLEDTVDRLRPHGAELVGKIERYEDMFLLCYLRGPGGIIVALAEPLR
ncbi:MAG: VOC family protein [Catenulisporales bacterium]|nr:VOC family protein [Catenulisporales bacterium]